MLHCPSAPSDSPKSGGDCSRHNSEKWPPSNTTTPLTLTLRRTDQLMQLYGYCDQKENDINLCLYIFMEIKPFRLEF